MNCAILIQSNIDEAKRYFTSSNGLTRSFLAEAIYSSDGSILNEAKVDADYAWKWQKAFESNGEVLTLSNNRFSFSFGGPFTVSVEFSEEQKRTRIKLIQSNSNPSKQNEFAFINCYVC